MLYFLFYFIFYFIIFLLYFFNYIFVIYFIFFHIHKLYKVFRYVSTLKEKVESFWPKKLSHCGTKIWPGILIGEYLSQIDSQYRMSIWLKLILNIESQFDSNIFNYSESRVEFQFRQWLNFLGQNDSSFSSACIQSRVLYSSV